MEYCYLKQLLGQHMRKQSLPLCQKNFHPIFTLASNTGSQRHRPRGLNLDRDIGPAMGTSKLLVRGPFLREYTPQGLCQQTSKGAVKTTEQLLNVSIKGWVQLPGQLPESNVLANHPIALGISTACLHACKVTINGFQSGVRGSQPPEFPEGNQAVDFEGNISIRLKHVKLRNSISLLWDPSPPGQGQHATQRKRAPNITTCQEQPTSQDAAVAHASEGAGVKPDQASKVLTLGCNSLTIPSPQAGLQIPIGLFLATHSFWH